MNRFGCEGQPVLGFEIVSLNAKKGREVVITIDLSKEDPSLVLPATRSLRAELDGIKECVRWNESKGKAIIDGRYNFKTGEITPAEVTEPVNSQLKSPPQRFVRRATRLDGKLRCPITRMPERHADNFPVVTGHNPRQFSNTIRRGHEAIHVWEVGPNGGYGRPHIPSRILKAPTVTADDLDLVGMKRPVIGAKAFQGAHTNGVLPSASFSIREIATLVMQRR